MATEAETRQDMNVPMIVTVALLSIVLLVVIVVSVDAWFHYEIARVRDTKSADAVYPELASLQQTQQAHLDTAPIPIDRAMEQVATATE